LPFDLAAAEPGRGGSRLRSKIVRAITRAARGE
jgi:hypothetical protein